MRCKIKGLPLALVFVIYLMTICFAGESDFLKPGEVRMAENHCKFFLRTLGSSEQAYMESNPNVDYGTWWSLQRGGYIEEGYNRSNYIEYYSISVFNVTVSGRMGGESAHDSSFTIVAVPTKYRNQLRTFAINDKQSPAVWLGNDAEFGSNNVPPTTPGLNDKRYWDSNGKKTESRIKFKDEKKKDARETRCILTLRALGSTQLAYMDGNFAKNYGTWQALADNDYIQEGYNRSNIIDNYSICVFQTTTSWKKSNHGKTYPSTFTIVAIPRSQKNRLRTFGIGDDQTPRVFVGDSSTFESRLSSHPSAIWFANTDMWEPIR